jgi:molybdopterin synthase sulfur carrier subunit
MSCVVLIPGALRELANNRAQVEIQCNAASISDAMSLLWKECPGIRDRVFTELGEVRPHVNIFVDGENIRYAGGLSARLRDGSEIMIVPAVSGG